LLDDRTDTGEAPRGRSAMRVFARGDRWLLARAAGALVLANVRYWITVAPLVRAELERWRGRAGAIPDPRLRELALAKLDGERFNAEAGAMCATLAPRARRRDVVAAIVALQLLFDLLDGLTEQPLRDPLGDGARLFAPFTDALRPGPQPPSPPTAAEDDYLRELSRAARAAIARLPARESVIEAAAAAAARAAQAQLRMHAAPRLGIDQLREWARSQAHGTGLGWRELAAGAASSVLVVHALIAAAADARTTPARAASIGDAYLSICVLLTLLDSLIDEQHDERAGMPGYIDLYQDRELLDRALGETAVRAAGQARALVDAPHHVMMLTGVVAFYTSAPGARGQLARPLVARLHRALAPLIAPTVAFMRAWRLARRVRGGNS
jgi:tetraprenyl-beta-curcumene synthase